MMMLKYFLVLAVVQVVMSVEVSKSTDVAGGKGTASLSLPETGGLMGKLSYERNLMNNANGKLDAFADVSHTSGLDPSSVTNLGGALKWSNENAFAKLGLDHTRHGSTQMDMLAGGQWKPDRNTEFNAGAQLSQTFGQGRPDYGFMANFIHRFP